MLRGSAVQCHVNAPAQGETEEQSDLEDPRAAQVEQAEQDIPEMREDPETEVLLVSMERKVSRAVLDRGASRVVVDTLEKRGNMERSAWMA